MKRTHQDERTRAIAHRYARSAATRAANKPLANPAPAGHTPTHTPGAVRAACIITGGDYNSPKRYKTAYGIKTCQGIADIIERETTAPELLEALREAEHVLRPLIPHSSPVLASIDAAIARATRETTP